MTDRDKPPTYRVFEDDLAMALIDAMTISQRRLLHAKLKALTFCGWLDWIECHGEAAQQFLQMSPKARASWQKASGADTFLFVCYGALWFAQLSGAMESWFHDPSLAVEWGDGRETRAARGRLLSQPSLSMIQPWPFDEPGDLRSPFDE